MNGKGHWMDGGNHWMDGRGTAWGGCRLNGGALNECRGHWMGGEVPDQWLGHWMHGEGLISVSMQE